MINCITNANALDKNRIFIFLFFFILKIKNKYQKQICKSRQFLCSVTSVERKKLKSKKKKQGKSFLKELTIFFFLIRRTHNFLSPLVFKIICLNLCEHNYKHKSAAYCLTKNPSQSTQGLQFMLPYLICIVPCRVKGIGTNMTCLLYVLTQHNSLDMVNKHVMLS